MPKAITLEMLQAMSPDQRKTLHANATARETPAAREVLALLATGDLMARPAVAKTPAKAAARGGPKTASAKPRATKTKVAAHGRQA